MAVGVRPAARIHRFAALAAAAALAGLAGVHPAAQGAEGGLAPSGPGLAPAQGRTPVQEEALVGQQASLAPAEDAPDQAKKAASASGWRYSGNTTFSLGFQRANGRSIYDPEGSTSGPSLVSEKATALLRASRPGVALTLDAQSERRPESSVTNSRINQFNVVFGLSDSVKLRLGKQRVLWGKGLTYIPTDFVNPPLDPLGLDIAKVGVPAVSVDYVHEDFSLTALARSEKNSVDSLGLKLSTSSLSSGLDLDLIYYRSPSVGYALGSSFALDVGQKIASLNGLVLSGGLAMHRKSRYPEVVHGSEGGFPYLQPGATGRKGHYVSWMLGGRYEFNERLSLTTEYYRIGDAYQSADYRAIIDCLADRGQPCRGLSAGWFERLSYGRNQRSYGTLSVSLDGLTSGHSRLTDTLGVEIGVLQGGDDQSRHFTLNIKSNYWDQAEINWRTFVAAGGQRSEFGTGPYRWYSQIMLTVGF